jgi:hypothetical protein
MDLSAAEHLLGEFQLWLELDRQAKQRNQRQLAPDFKLMAFLQRGENALSSYICILLDPKGTHGQGDLYLTKFLAFLPAMDFASSPELLGTYTEFRLPSHRRMDVYLRFRRGGLAIENKPWAGDQKEQLLDYAKYLQSQHPDAQWRLIYLCNGEISEHTLPKDAPPALTEQVTTLDFFQLTRWLEQCALHTRAPAVRLFVEALEQFVREQINGELLVENGQELTALILRNEKNIRAAFQISQQLHAAKRHMWYSLQEHLSRALADLGAELVFEEALVNGASHSKIGIRFSPEDICGPSWAFNKYNHQDLYFGISAWRQEDIAEIPAEAIREAMTAFCGMSSATPTGWWPWWTFDTRAFSSYPVHSNWDIEPDAWLALQDLGEHGFAAHIINAATRFKKEFDLTLLEPR